MREHSRSVDAFPPEGAVRKLVDKRPAHLLRYEAWHARRLYDLRQLRRVTERIGKPESVRCAKKSSLGTVVRVELVICKGRTSASYATVKKNPLSHHIETLIGLIFER